MFDIFSRDGSEGNGPLVLLNRVQEVEFKRRFKPCFV